MSVFLSRAKVEMGSLTASLDEMDALVVRILKLFGELPAELSIEELFKTLSIFFASFERAHNENVARRKEEERRAAKKAARRDRRASVSTPASTPATPEAGEGFMDHALSAIKDGEFNVG